MKAAVLAGLLAAWAGAGCLWMNRVAPEPAAPAEGPAKDSRDKDWEKVWHEKHQPAVTAQNVTEANARQVAEDLLRELDREAQQTPRP
jgi:hypothetical protein